MWLFLAPDKWLLHSSKLACLLLAVALSCLFAYQALSSYSLLLSGWKLWDCEANVKWNYPCSQSVNCSAETLRFPLCTIDLVTYCLCSLGLITTLLEPCKKGSDFIMNKCVLIYTCINWIVCHLEDWNTTLACYHLKNKYLCIHPAKQRATFAFI